MGQSIKYLEWEQEVFMLKLGDFMEVSRDLFMVKYSESNILSPSTIYNTVRRFETRFS